MIKHFPVAILMILGFTAEASFPVRIPIDERGISQPKSSFVYIPQEQKTQNECTIQIRSQVIENLNTIIQSLRGKCIEQEEEIKKLKAVISSLSETDKALEQELEKTKAIITAQSEKLAAQKQETELFQQVAGALNRTMTKQRDNITKERDKLYLRCLALEKKLKELEGTESESEEDEEC